MKKLSLIILVILPIILLTSCNKFVDVRVKTISDRSIIRLSVHEYIIKLYQEGDTVTIHHFSGHSWEIENNSRRKDESIWYDGMYIYTSKSKTDSTYMSGYLSTYKNVVIEKILTD